MDPTQPAQQPQNPTSPTQPDRVPIKSLRTYQGDVEEALHRNNYSATTVFMAEQKRKADAPRVPEKPRPSFISETRNKLFTTVGISLFALGILVVGAVYYVRSNEKVEVEQKTKALIEFSAEQNIEFALMTRENFLQSILTEKRGWKEAVNSVLFLNIIDSETKRTSVEDIIPKLAPLIPSSLGRAFEEEYMFGIISYDTNEPFIIFKTNDYASAYAGMLRWEKDMVSDIGALWNIGDTGTSTAIFIDEALRNKDLRILKDSANNTVLVYSFIDKNTLVITKNEDIFNAILAKYLTSQNVR